MTARRMILLTLAFLLPCGFLILLTRSFLRSSIGERFLKGTTTTRKLVFLASAVLAVAALAPGCGGGTQLTQSLAPRVVSSGTEFEGISGGSSLTSGNNVVLRGLLFKTAGDPILVAKKVRKP